MQRLKKFIFASTVVAVSLLNSQIFASTFKTNLDYPAGLQASKVFNLTQTNGSKTLFYTGRQNGQYVSGFYRDTEFLGWTDNRLTIFDTYPSTQEKRLLSVVEGPNNNTILLGDITGVGQTFSTSTDGTNWSTRQILAKTNFDTLVSTNVSNTQKVIAYGKTNSAYYVTDDSSNWYQYGMPASCSDPQNCRFDTYYFGNVGDNYIVVQSVTISGSQENILYNSSDLQNWYAKNVPFTYADVQKVFTGKFNTLLVSAINKDGSNALWITPNLDNWVSFDLPKFAQVMDVIVYNKNRIDLLLFFQENGLLPTTQYATLDTETKTITVNREFDGKISHMKDLESKLYLSGDFYNKDDGHRAILASTAN